MTDEVMRNVGLWFESLNLDQVEAYAKSGRRFSSVSTVTLKEDWAKNFGQWARNLDFTARKNFEDQQAELQLRGEEPPFADVENDMKELRRKAEEVLEQAKSDPDRWREMYEGVDHDLQEFLQSLEKAKQQGH